MKLIINADDFGYNSNVNRAIADSFEKNLCTNTTLMVNMPFAEEAVEIAHSRGFFNKVGLHVNLTEGKPLTDSIRRLKIFCNEEGHFNGHFHGNIFSRLYLDSKVISIVREEINAQLKEYAKYKLTLFHLDSHHHSHTDYPIFRAIKPLIKKYNVRSIRISRNIFASNSVQNKVYKFFFNRYLSKTSPYNTNYFGSINDFVSQNSKMRKINNLIIELMVHPMYRDDKIFDTNTELIKEVANINCSYNLVSYADIR